jgi:hypothetical protein
MSRGWVSLSEEVVELPDRIWRKSHPTLSSSRPTSLVARVHKFLIPSSSRVNGSSRFIFGDLLKMAMVECSIFKPSSTYFKVDVSNLKHRSQTICICRHPVEATPASPHGKSATCPCGQSHARPSLAIFTRHSSIAS